MFGTFAFSDYPFATQDVTNIVIPPLVEVLGGGSFARKKKKYKLYEIFGKTYSLTESEYQHYLLQRKKYKEKVEIIDNTIVETKQEVSLNELVKLYGRPIDKINKLEIPFISQYDNESYYNYLLNKLKEINIKRKKRMQDDNIAIEMLLISGYIF
jgi:hypothetical protein